MQEATLFLLLSSVSDPHHVDANPDPHPDPACHFDADPDPTFHFDVRRLASK
jgi:hypothetical protein